MTLYRNFTSKDELILEFLRAARGALDARLAAGRGRAPRHDAPAQRLLAIFDVFGEWFARDDFEGCSFVNVLLEIDDRDHAVRQASVGHLATIREYLRGLARGAGIEDADGFARQWHILMKGSIVSAAEGDTEAAARARELGALLLAHHGVTA